MGYERLIPERTIDSLLAAELIRHDQYALIWSPSQFDDAADHVLYGQHAQFAVFECKAVTSNRRLDPLATWRIQIERRQLSDYAELPYPVMYLFLARPTALERPEYRPCSIGSCSDKACVACCRDGRSWGSLAPNVQTAPLTLRLQPWFCHWAWVVTASNLLEFLDSSRSSWSTATVNLEDHYLESIPGASRLCHAFPEIIRGGSWTVPIETLMVMGRDVHWPRHGDYGDFDRVAYEAQESTPPVFGLLSSNQAR